MSNDFAGRGTSKGVKANHPLGRLVNVTNGIEIKRIRWQLANALVNSEVGRRGGWNFCPKKFKLEGA
jgi:hypothetical protein